MDILDIFGEEDDLKRQCNFLNTLGMRCPETYIGSLECCKNHQCTYMLRKNIQCNEMINCKSKWYCTKHGERCRCQHLDSNGEQCRNSIYFYMYLHGAGFCEKHKCKLPNCIYEIQNKEYNICKYHFEAVIFCDYTHNNQRCKNIVGYFNNNYDTISSSFMRSSCMCVNAKYCDEHKCHDDKCNQSIRNEKTPWCFNHSRRCEFISKNKERCENYKYYKYTDADLSEQLKLLSWNFKNISKKNPEKEYINEDPLQEIFLCSKHQCHWTKQECKKSINDTYDDSIFCKEHYSQNLFYEYEYFTQ